MLQSTNLLERVIQYVGAKNSIEQECMYFQPGQYALCVRMITMDTTLIKNHAKQIDLLIRMSRFFIYV